MSLLCDFQSSCSMFVLFYVQVSSDLSIIDLDIPFNLSFTVSASINASSALVVLAVVTWQVLFVTIPMVYLAISLQVNTRRGPFKNNIMWKQFSFIHHLNQ